MTENMLSIKLHSPPSVFLPGDHVAGEVRYEPNGKSSTEFRTVVELLGQTNTKLSNGRNPTTRGHAELIRFIVTTMQGPATTCPFAFTFPGTTHPVDPSIADRGNSTAQMATLSPTHLLPPTFEFGTSPGRKILGNKGVAEYKLRAVVLSTSDKVLCQEELPVIFEPRVDPQYSHWHEDRSANMKTMKLPMRVQTLHLLPENQNRQLKYSERTRAIFQRSKIPYFNFHLATTLPTKLNLGQNIPLLVQVDPEPTSSTAPQVPTFTLNQISTDIVATVTLYGGPTFHQEQVAVVSRKMENLGDLEPSSNFTKTVIVAPIWTILPSFDTYNITYKHSIVVTGEIECAGKKIPIFNQADLKILPAVRGATPQVPYVPDKRELQEPVPYEELKPSLTRYIGKTFGSTFSLIRHARTDSEVQQEQKSNDKVG
ncbi:uncharacterized protein BJX67DRAFT_367909 [Aspergillus lucknowensis]|uniref:Arrestin-like N-terminal domain-containing protein n=1 Tax=Aspergillus lucknowensis TaxID=176173 RepID=A0ABR4L8Z0_9EURO